MKTPKGVVFQDFDYKSVLCSSSYDSATTLQNSGSGSAYFASRPRKDNMDVRTHSVLD